MSKNQTPSKTGRPEAFNATVQGKLESALAILKVRYARNFPAFIKAVTDYQEKLGALSQAGSKLSGELSRLGGLYKNSYGQSMARLGQSLLETDQLRNQLAGNLNTRFSGPMDKSLSNEKQKFASNEKKVQKTIATYEAELQKMVQNLAKEQVAGTNRILENVAAITKKVQEFDAVNVEMLRDLQQSQQKQFIEWSEKWHAGMSAQLDFHEAMEKKLEKIAPLWDPAVADGADAGQEGQEGEESEKVTHARADID
eukprot:TRINITY_DN283_c0_g1_i2.p2 TRINITY_DN283_c0_g1~~TRINITY_DN283_c0_g1_i2.p2  ORF type:complete len:255 (+),score=117.53 TRINITY_DN283_c0_g1_i2:45-809(+)